MESLYNLELEELPGSFTRTLLSKQDASNVDFYLSSNFPWQNLTVIEVLPTLAINLKFQIFH